MSSWWFIFTQHMLPKERNRLMSSRHPNIFLPFCLVLSTVLSPLHKSHMTWTCFESETNFNIIMACFFYDARESQAANRYGNVFTPRSSEKIKTISIAEVQLAKFEDSQKYQSNYRRWLDFEAKLT